MSEEKKKSKEKFSWLKDMNFFRKLKQVKHIGLIITIIFIAILLLILFGDFGFFSKNTNQTISVSSGVTYTSNQEYSKYIEDKLCTLIKGIKDTGNVNVMVTLDGGTSLVLASKEEKVTKGSGSDLVTTVSTTPVVIDKNGNSSTIVIEEVLPKIKGVVVVSSGAKDIAVKINIINAIQTLLDLDSSQIQILVGK